MERAPRMADRRALLDAKLTELVLYAKGLCPEALVEASGISYEDEDGHVEIYPPPSTPEEEEERIETAIAARAGAIFDETGLYIVCAVFDLAAREEGIASHGTRP